MNIFEWNEQIPVTANNLNEMQNIINGNIGDYYSTSEMIVGKWIDGKPIYRKVITTNSLVPSGSNYLNVPHGINNLDKVVNIECIAYDSIPEFFDFNNYCFYDNGAVIGTTHVFVFDSEIMVVYEGAGIIDWIDGAYFILDYTKSTN